jgi:2-dehydro-3-deoxyphosphooctonate aldolase (KDO 8-P synthase)
MNKLKLIAGPCAIENDYHPFSIAERVLEICNKLDIEYIFKGSYKKANRTSLDSFTGIDRSSALSILKGVGDKFGIPVLTDVHESADVPEVSEYVDYLQIPAFLCRQTDLLLAAGKTGKHINIKKGQFVSPSTMEFAVEKVRSTGNNNILLTERGTTFGYNNLIVDFTSFPTMKSFGVDTIMDATHCLQRPNQSTGVTGGDPSMIGHMCYAAMAVGADGLFIETHPDPSSAMSDSSTMLQLDKLEAILRKCIRIREI